MNRFFLKIHKNLKFVSLGLLGFFMICMGLLINSYALSEPVPKISFSSKTLSYEEKEPGSWQVEKSAEWIGLGKARITFQVDTVLKKKNPNTDVILVLDVSASMSGNKLNRVKEDSIDLIDSLLSDPNNHAALISFDTDSKLISDFTNDKDGLIEKVRLLSEEGNTNYYQPLVDADEILKKYQKKEDTDCVLLFLTDGYPNVDVPNQIGEYYYLKTAYPWLNIHGIQYEMGKEILDPIKAISDKQFIADMITLRNALVDASVVPTLYDNFILTDWINNDYFDLKDVLNIQPSFGTVKLEDDNGVPKVTWDLSGLGSGQKVTLTIDVELKDNSYTGSEINPTNKKSNVVSQIEEDEEDTTVTNSPSLKTHYKVIYDGNVPDGCRVDKVPEVKEYAVYETVGKHDDVLTCEGYQFKGWRIATDGVGIINDDYFKMPEKDVTIKAEWGKMGLSKTMDGTVYREIRPIIQKIGVDGYEGELWQYKESITKIVIEGEQTTKDGSTDELTWDISEAKDGSVRGLLIPNPEDPSTYTAYIQGLGGKVIANPNSSYLFGGGDGYSNSFLKLTTIEGLELLNTSQVTNMSHMFYSCEPLISVGNLNGWDTSKVVNMDFMFQGCHSLIDLNFISEWNTSQVTNMSQMFDGCRALTSLEAIREWDTSQVTDMSYMFAYCYALTSLEAISEWDTSQVTNMSNMFYSCDSIESLEGISKWDTRQVLDMSGMFINCSFESLESISGWDTARVTNMSYMFSGCNFIESLESISGWDTSQVTNMQNMFEECGSLTDLEGIKGWNMSHVTNMSYMFSKCYSLFDVDLSNWNTLSAVNMSYLFSNCNFLRNLNLSGLKTGQVTDMRSMFEECKALTSLDLSSWDTSKVANMRYMFSGCNTLTNLDLNGWDTGRVTNMERMFYNCIALISLDLSGWDISSVSDWDFMFSGTTGELIVNNWKVGLSLNEVFYSFKGTEIKGLDTWDTSQVTDMSQMFLFCDSLTSIEGLSGWNTGQVTSMSQMFSSCKSLTSVGDLSQWDTSHVTNMWEMFSYCKSIKSLSLSGWKTDQVTSMGDMFDNCSSLISLDLSGWDTSHVTDMSSMFISCGALTSLEGISDWDTRQVNNMRSVFYGCQSLVKLDLSSWDTSEVTAMNGMFSGCTSLESIGNIESWDVGRVTDMSSMFSECHFLTTTISILNPLVTSYSKMFYNAATTNGARIIVIYSSGSLDLVEEMIATKNNENSNVMKGNQQEYQSHSITIQGRNDIVSSQSSAFPYVEIKLTSNQDHKLITSFEMNGTPMEGNTFKMPNKDVIITNVTVVDGWESEHNPYGDNLNEVYEATFEGAGSLTIMLHYSTDEDYIYLYDRTGKQYGEYEGWMNAGDIIIIPGDYVKLNFVTNGSFNELYGFQAIITPNAPHSVELKSPPYDIGLSNDSPVLGDTVELVSPSENYVVTSFKMNGTLVEGDSFVMPDEDVEISDIIAVKGKILESEHYPYGGNLNEIYEATLDGAGSLTVTLDYQLYGYGDIYGDSIYLYDKLDNRYDIDGIHDGTSNRKTTTIVIPGDYVKLNFVTDDDYNSYYGFRAIVIYNESHPITVESPPYDIVANQTSTGLGDTVKLVSPSGKYAVTSFRMNGTLVEGNSFIMPDEPVTISDIEAFEGAIFESDHNPYKNNLNESYVKKFAGASSLTVTLEYQTETDFDWVYLYDKSGVELGKYGGSTRTTETIVIPGNYVKIVFYTDSATNAYYGFKAVITVNEPHSVTLESSVYDIVANKEQTSLKDTVTLVSSSGNYRVVSFKMNGKEIQGNTFEMPDEEAKITDIVVESRHSIVVTGNEDIEAHPDSAFVGDTVTLSSVSGNNLVTSFDMNGSKVEGNSFVMPDGSVSISNIVVVQGFAFESSHNSYDNNLNEEYEKTFAGATSLTVTLEYQTEGINWDYICLYDRVGTELGKYGGHMKKTETIVIPGEYVKILFHTDSSINEYYGFKATIVPNYG